MKSWEREDKLYTPKRRVQNRRSRWMPHVIGSFYSSKMKRSVEYESLGEYLFYSFLELDTQTVRYYVQPVEISIPCLGEHGTLSHWMHVPDVLVYREGSQSTLYQVKDPSYEPSDEDEVLDECCTKFAMEKGWDYVLIRPKAMPTVVASNVEFLVGFLKPRMGF